jgi:hypothetical protein
VLVTDWLLGYLTTLFQEHGLHASNKIKGKCQDSVLKQATTSSLYFPIHYLLLSLSFDAIGSELLTVSLNKPKSIINKCVVYFGRIIAHVVSRLILAAEDRFRSQGRPCGICGGQSGTRIGFSPCPSVLQCQYHPPLLHIHSSITWEMDNEPVIGRSSTETQSHHIATIR